jgi:phage I-like protein
MHLLTPLLNRENQLPADGWYHLIKTGDHPLRLASGSVCQRLDATACEAIAADFRNRRAADPSHRLLIDFEHFSHDTGKRSEAAGWITALENRADGVWFQAEWSDLGETAIKNRRYRSISPVWFPHQCEQVADGIYRPLRVNDAGLTNKPNLQGLVPFWNRAADTDERAPEQQPEQQPENQDKKMKEQLIALLGLAADADDAAVLAAVKALKDSSDKSATEAAPLKNRFTVLETQYKTLLGDSVAKELEANKDVIPEGQVAAWKNRLEADFAGTAGLLRGIKRPEVRKTPVHEPGKGAAAAAKKTGADSDPGEVPFLNRVRELMDTEKLTELQAIDKAAAASPQLYKEYVGGFRGETSR